VGTFVTTGKWMFAFDWKISCCWHFLLTMCNFCMLFFIYQFALQGYSFLLSKYV